VLEQLDCHFKEELLVLLDLGLRRNACHEEQVLKANGRPFFLDHTEFSESLNDQIMSHDLLLRILLAARTSLNHEVVRLTWLVKDDRDYLEEDLAVNLGHGLHEVRLCHQVKNVVNCRLPDLLRKHLVARELFADQEESRDPEKLKAEVSAASLERLTFREVSGHSC